MVLVSLHPLFDHLVVVAFHAAFSVPEIAQGLSMDAVELVQ